MKKAGKRSKRFCGVKPASSVTLACLKNMRASLLSIRCDIDVETGPRQLPSRHLRKRLNFFKGMYPPPDGYSVFPEDDEPGKTEPRTK